MNYRIEYLEDVFDQLAKIPKNIRLTIIRAINRLLSKQRYFEEFIGAYGAQDRRVLVVHEDPSTEATQKLPKERMFRKKSIENYYEVD
jgi:hypothetical protein